jgi:hypothetical protein
MWWVLALSALARAWWRINYGAKSGGLWKMNVVELCSIADAMDLNAGEKRRLFSSLALMTIGDFPSQALGTNTRKTQTNGRFSTPLDIDGDGDVDKSELIAAITQVRKQYFLSVVSV